MARNTIQCLVSGKSYTLTKDNYTKKIEEYKDEETLKKFFVTKKVKSYLERGYNIQEIRNILGVQSSDLPSADAECMQELATYHNLLASAESRKTSSRGNFINHKTDSDVAVFINNIKNLNL
jgi:glycyl-tRNA synthetase beta subunit